MEVSWNPLKEGTYTLIMADPPWSFKTWSAKGHKKGAQAKYSCMSIEEIRGLPVGRLAAPDSCLFLWATWPLLAEALGVLTAWGFVYKTGGHWQKMTKNGLLAFGTGYRARSASEPWLLGFKGNPKNSKGHRNAIVGEAREHSRKPDEAYDWARTYVEGPKCDLFSREDHDGFACWGDEVGKFNGNKR